MSLTRAGRPRLHAQRRPGITARDEILDAAAEFFTTLGYAATSTRAIAESVGIRQASLYHYFKTKDDILCALLSQTVTPTLSFLPLLTDATRQLTADQRLHALAAFDGAQLVSGRWNLGSLYLLPELRGTGLEQFYSDRERLRQHYLSLSMEVAARTGVDPAAADLPFRLVESLVNMWSAPRNAPQPELAMHVADACLRVLGVVCEQIPALRERTREVLLSATRVDAAAEDADGGECLQ